VHVALCALALCAHSRVCRAGRTDCGRGRRRRAGRILRSCSGSGRCRRGIAPAAAATAAPAASPSAAAAAAARSAARGACRAGGGRGAGGRIASRAAHTAAAAAAAAGAITRGGGRLTAAELRQCRRARRGCGCRAPAVCRSRPPCVRGLVRVMVFKRFAYQGGPALPTQQFYALHSACIPCDFGSGSQRLQVACTETQHEPALSRWRMASGGKSRVWRPPVHACRKPDTTEVSRHAPCKTDSGHSAPWACSSAKCAALPGSHARYMAALSNWAPPRQVEQAARTLLARGRRRQQLVPRRALRAEPQRRRARRTAGRAGSAGCGVAGRDVEAGGAAWRRVCLCQRRHSVRQWAIEGMRAVTRLVP